VAQGPSTNEAGLKVVGRTFVAIQVRDEVAAADWYIGVFGLEEVNRLEAADGPYSIRILSGGGISVELIRNHATSARTTEPPLGLFKAGFYVDDIEATLAWLRSRGVDTDRTVFTDPALQARTFTFRDLEGNRWQAFEPCGADCGE
jgi:catechol 2,3-dioxygenase-like lactoylglutathione lyase family enzyme